jgi:cytosine/adenosine deaminase-related metal-dependent hydrolase
VKAITNVHVYDFETYSPDSFVIYDENIIKIGPMKKFKDKDYEIIDGKGQLLLPGLINFHTHIYSTLIRGLDLGVTPENFLDILNDVWWRFDRVLTCEDLYESALRYGEDAIRNGVTALVDHNASGEISGSLEALRRGIKEVLGMKGLFCFETSDRFNLGDSIKENLSAIKNGDGLFGLHASLTLSDESLSRVSQVLETSPIHIHVAESKMDEEDALQKYRMSVVHRLGRFNLLNRNSILAHCVHIDDEEAELIAMNKCCVALNPTSNLNNAVGIFDYKRLITHGVTLLVGTDGLGSNVAKEWQSLYYLGKHAMGKPSGIGLEEVKGHIRESYLVYNALSGDQVGLLKEGYSADMVLLDYKPPTPMDKKTIFAHVFYGLLDSFRPSHVFIEGKIKLENYVLVEGIAESYGKVLDLWEKVRES